MPFAAGRTHLRRRLLLLTCRGGATLRCTSNGRAGCQPIVAERTPPPSGVVVVGTWERFPVAFVDEGRSRRAFTTGPEYGKREGGANVRSSDNRDLQRRQRGLPLYLHVGPSGDVWTGDAIFAAKHLQPDYVKSVSLEGEAEAMIENEGSLLVETLESRLDWTQEIYDTGTLPAALRQQFLDQSQE